jgi:hypothetical protein
VELLKSKFKTEIPYGQIFDIQKVDAGNKDDLERVIGYRLGSIVGLLWKRHHIITIIKYTDETYENQTIAFDFEINTEYAQPIIEKKMRKLRNLPAPEMAAMESVTELPPGFPAYCIYVPTGMNRDFETSVLAELKEWGRNMGDNLLVVDWNMGDESYKMR